MSLVVTYCNGERRERKSVNTDLLVDIAALRVRSKGILGGFRF